MRDLIKMIKNLFFSKKEKIDSNFKGFGALSEKAKGRKNKFLKWFVIAIGASFLVAFILKIYKLYQEDSPEYAVLQEQKEREMTKKEGENIYFQIAITEEYKRQNEEIRKLQNEEEKKKKQIERLIKSTTEMLKKGEENLIKEGKKNTESIKKLEEKILNIQTETEASNKKLKQEVMETVKDLNPSNYEEIMILTQEVESLRDKIASLEKNKKQANKKTLKNIDENLEDPQNLANKDTLINEDKDSDENALKATNRGDATANKASSVVKVTFYKPTMKMRKESKGKSQEKTNQGINTTLEVPMGMAEAILLTGAEAPINGFNGEGDRDSPVAIKLLTNMIVANDNFTQVEDCLLLGNARGELASNRAIIRLVQMSCIYQDRASGKKYSAFGKVKGWVYDENASLGVSGTLISRESKIIQTAIPMTLLQAGLDYISNSQTNIFVDGNNIANSLGKSFGSGLSNGAGKSIDKLMDYYTNFLDALSPTISFRSGRKISILFRGGEIIQLKPYQDGGVGEAFLNLGDFEEKRLLVGDEQ